MHNLDKVRNATVVFLSTYGAFRTYQKIISPRWPQYNKHLYIGGRRVHHYESGMYIAALGLALLLDDIHDWNEDRL